jgi:mannose/fructose/N-acetylgalactosamine-specific phosphotransferase system component IID
MKTPVPILLTAIAYWIGVSIVLMVPQFSTNQYLTILWVTVVIPNVLRIIVGTIPQLAVDRVFFLSTTLIAFAIITMISSIWSVPRDVLKKDETSNASRLITSSLIIGTFVAGALLTYYTGIDTSIYSEMGWENQGLTT